MIKLSLAIVLVPTIAMAATIQEVQTDPGLLGQIVTVEGVVTVGNDTYSSTPQNIAVIQDGTGPWSGVMIYCGGGLPTLAIGDRVEVTGEVAEYFDRTEIDISDAADVSVIGSETPPPVTWITANDIATSNPGVAEGYEGVLVGIENVTVVGIDSYEFTAQDASGECLVGWWSVAWDACPVNLDDTYSSIVGLADYSYGAYKLQPRNPADYNYPVPVEFGTLSADSRGNTVIIRWSTVTEKDNFGFEVLRSLSEDGEFTRINDTIIPGAGTTQTAQIYLYSDRDVVPDETYFYMIRDIGTDGTSENHGPVSCTFTPSAVGSWGELKAEFDN